jgi:hypothetical protein
MPAKHEPRNRLPESPRKMDAGWKLKQRNPTVAPARMIVTVAGAHEPVVARDDEHRGQREQRSAGREPSSPSMRLNAFVMPTNHDDGEQHPMMPPRLDDADERSDSVETARRR